MSSDAGGYGTMVFPDEAALAKWKRAKISPEAYDDWIGDFEGGGIEPDETVAKRLGRIAKGHAPKRRTVQQVEIDGTRVTLTWQIDTVAFESLVTDFAAFVRSADAFGAKGTFYFLGFNGAEGDFGYAVTLDGKRSKVSELPRKQLMKLVRSDEFRAFEERVSAALENGNPAIKKREVARREGTKADPSGDDLYATVLASLKNHSDAEVMTALAKWDWPVPTGKGTAKASQAFSVATVRAQITKPMNEETRALALFALGDLDPAAAIPIAFKVLRAKKVHDHMIAAALHAVAHATNDGAALQLAERYLLKAKSAQVVDGGGAVFTATVHPALAETVERVLDQVTDYVGSTLVFVMKQRALETLAPALERYATRTNSMQAKQLLAEWGVAGWGGA